MRVMPRTRLFVTPSRDLKDKELCNAVTFSPLSYALFALRHSFFIIREWGSKRYTQYIHASPFYTLFVSMELHET